MDIRVKMLRSGEKDSALSRSCPPPSAGNFLQRCIDGNGSSDAISSVGSRSPKLGKYRKIPNYSDCDVCHVSSKDLTNLKCLHTFCTRCIDFHGIIKNGCPVCNNLCIKKGLRQYKNSPKVLTCEGFYPRSDKYSPEKEMSGTQLDNEFIFRDVVDDILEDNYNLEDTLVSLESHVLKEVETRYDSIKEELQTIELDSECEIHKIREHLKHVKNILDRKSETMIKNIRDSKARHSAELQRQEKFFKNMIEKVKKLIKQCKNTIDSALDPADHSYQKAERSARDMLKLSSQFADEKVHIRFNCKPATESNIEHVSGRVGVRVFMASPLLTTLVNTFEFDGGVHSICPVNGRHAWIGYQNFVQLCSKDGGLDAPLNVGEEIYDLALDHTGDVIIACQDSVKKLNSQSQLKTLFHCETTLHGIACLPDGNIVGCGGKQVTVYNTQGGLVRRISDSLLGDIKLPFKVAINANGDICVSDYQSSAGEVSIFDCEGRLKAKLRTEGMAPRGVFCNQQGFIYVGDFRADRVNVYSAHGHFLQTVVTTGSDGLSGPLSVAIDTSGDLWVGDWKRKVRIYSQRVTEFSDECL